MLTIEERAESHLSARPRAFLRWAGSKKGLLRYILPHVPKQYARYHEPFLGSGALFFLLKPKSALLSDYCVDLISTYRALRDNYGAVARNLRPLRLNQSTFYRTRAEMSASKYKRAAEFIYLNKACWNGLYRVNLSGVFNVPYGRPKTKIVIDDWQNLKDCANTLAKRGVCIRSCDFEENIDRARAGDFVYADPPYVTSHNKNGFAEYNERIFSWEDQKRLFKALRRAANRGVAVLASNANHMDIIDLYRGFNAIEISRHSTLAADRSRRIPVSEVLLVPNRFS